MSASLPDRIAEANARALARLASASPVLTRVRPAGELIAALRAPERTVLHAGPPIAVPALCGSMRGAIIGAAILEGWAAAADDAAARLDAGTIALRSAHASGAVGPMAGIVSPSMPVFEVRDESSDAVAYCPINEGVGAVLRFGAYGEDVLSRLRWIGNVLGPALDAAVERHGGIPLIPLMARALTMGDEMHQRNVAATGLFYREVSPALVGIGLPRSDLEPVLEAMARNDQFFLNLAMAAAKCVMVQAEGIAHSTLVTAMSRNGVEFGIRVSGLGERWFTAPSPRPEGLYFPGYGPDDANADMGDSAIIETVGLGAFAMAAAPAVAGFVGLSSAREAVAATEAMREITLAESAHFAIPALDFAGTPTGIDIRRVVQLEVAPLINTGIAHRRAGIGQIGAGVARAPLEAFQRALEAFAEKYPE